MALKGRQFLFAIVAFYLVLPLFVVFLPWFRAQILMGTGGVALIGLVARATSCRTVSVRGLMLAVTAFAVLFVGATTPYSQFMTTETMTLRIKVRDDETKLPIASATVSVAEAEDARAASALHETTDESGAAAIELECYTTITDSMLIRGRHVYLDRTVVVEADGYQSTSRELGDLIGSRDTVTIDLRPNSKRE